MDEKRAVVLSSELHTCVRPHTFKKFGVQTQQDAKLFSQFFRCTPEQLCLQVVKHFQRLLWGQPQAHQKAPLLHRHFQRAAGSHLVQLVAVKDPRGVSALYHRVCGRQSRAW